MCHFFLQHFVKWLSLETIQKDVDWSCAEHLEWEPTFMSVFSSLLCTFSLLGKKGNFPGKKFTCLLAVSFCMCNGIKCLLSIIFTEKIAVDFPYCFWIWTLVLRWGLVLLNDWINSFNFLNFLFLNLNIKFSYMSTVTIWLPPFLNPLQSSQYHLPNLISCLYIHIHARIYNLVNPLRFACTCICLRLTILK